MNVIETGPKETMVLTQVKLNALLKILAEKGIITDEEITAQMEKEVEMLEKLAK